jgi:hypothetical protein
MSSSKLFNISNRYMAHCGINRWDESIEKKRLVNYMYLATSTQIGQTEISNGSNTVLTFSQTSDFSNILLTGDRR